MKKDIQLQKNNSCTIFQSNPLGLYISVTVVITFHPMFITMVDKAYNVQCFYMEADKQVTAELGVRYVNRQPSTVLSMINLNQ